MLALNFESFILFSVNRVFESKIYLIIFNI